MATNAQSACSKFNTALAIEENNIVGMTNQASENTGEFALSLIQDKGVYDLSNGCNPRKIRYRAAPPAHVRYVDILNCSDEEVEMQGRDCLGNNKTFTVNGNSKSGCSLPQSNELSFGYDEFGREVKGLSHRTSPFCAMDFVQKGKEHTSAFFSALRMEFKKYGVENFERELRTSIVELSETNVSIQDTDNAYSSGNFFAPPTGQYTINHLIKLKRRLMRNGWPQGEQFCIWTSRELAIRAIEHDKSLNSNGEFNTQYNWQITPDGKPNFADLYRGERIEYKGICFLITDTPMRAVNIGGCLKYIEPYIAGEGTGGGLVWRSNPDYDSCKYTCEGVTYDVFEVALFGSRNGLHRYKMGQVQLPGQGKTLGSNFEMLRIDGAHIECNENNERMALMMQHRFILEPENPELFGAILSLYAPECIKPLVPCCPDADEVKEDPVEACGESNPLADECFLAQCEPCDPEDAPQPLETLPEEDALCDPAKVAPKEKVAGEVAKDDASETSDK